ncbi:hypothetical protein BJX99DRAFT_228260 [Aspergillus californicus]
MRLTDSWFNFKPRKTVFVALAALCLACTLLLLFYQYEGLPLSWDRPVAPITNDAPIDPPNPTQSSDNSPSDDSNNYNANQSNPSNAVQADRRCQAFSDPGNVVFVIKTGATEVYEKLPTQLLTTLGCVQDFLLFSDLDEHIGHYRLRDTLADFNATLKETLPDFQLYRLQHEFRRTGQDMAVLKGESAWKLDKYKFLHLVEKAYLERPGRDWYFFIETDTYVVWTNLILWLQKVSPPTEPLYLGSIAYFMNDPFAHGGSGIVISGKLLEQFIGDKPGLANKYDDSFESNCCGDSVLANTIQKELNLKVQNMWPQINGEKPSSIAFGPMQWCQPLITMHHLHPRERTAIFDFEQARPDLSKPLTFSELSRLPFPPLTTTVNSTSTSIMRLLEEDWDNFSNIRISFAGEIKSSLEVCRDACYTGLEGCFQWRYNSDGECDVSTQAFRLGEKKMPDGNGKSWISGWNTEYIERWRTEHDCGDEVLWVEPY